MNTKTKVILAFAFIFLAGVVSGTILNQAVTTESEILAELNDDRESRWQQFRGRDSERPDRQRRTQRQRGRLADQLELTDEQNERFFDLMRDYRSDLRDEIRIMRDREHEITRQHYQSFRDDLMDFLNVHQLDKLDRHLHPDSVRTRQFRYHGRD